MIGRARRQSHLSPYGAYARTCTLNHALNYPYTSSRIPGTGTGNLISAGQTGCSESVSLCPYRYRMQQAVTSNTTKHPITYFYMGGLVKQKCALHRYPDHAQLKACLFPTSLSPPLRCAHPNGMHGERVLAHTEAWRAIHTRSADTSSGTVPVSMDS